MELKIVQRNGFCICGYAVETDAANNDSDISELYADFFSSGKEKILANLPGSKKGYYGLSWYTSGHERYCYLLGMEVSADIMPPEGAVLKEIPPAVFAYAGFPSQDLGKSGTDVKQAWTDFFFTEIPAAGYTPDEAHGYYFEYYPESVHGKYELWTPVVKANVLE